MRRPVDGKNTTRSDAAQDRAGPVGTRPGHRPGDHRGTERIRAGRPQHGANAPATARGQGGGRSQGGGSDLRIFREARGGQGQAHRHARPARACLRGERREPGRPPAEDRTAVDGGAGRAPAVDRRAEQGLNSRQGKARQERGAIVSHGVATLTSALAWSGLTWAIQSSALLALGLLAGRLLRRTGPAVQSGVYRPTLVAVLVCPFASTLLASMGYEGPDLRLPGPAAGRTRTADATAVASVAVSADPGRESTGDREAAIVAERPEPVTRPVGVA